VKLLRNLAGAAVLAVVAVLLLVGARSPSGSSILSPLGQSAAATGRAWRANIPGLRLASEVAGNAWAALAVASVLIVLATWLIPAARSGRGMVVIGVLAAVLGFVLYQPGVLS
jgi:hypothetical protein